MIRRRNAGTDGRRFEFAGFDADKLRRALAVYANRGDGEGRAEDAVSQQLDDPIAGFESLYGEKTHLGPGRDRFSQQCRLAAVGRADRTPLGQIDRADKRGSELDPVLRLAGNQLQALQIIERRTLPG